MIKMTDIRFGKGRRAVQLALLLAVSLLLVSLFVPAIAYAASPTDAIRLYTIQADVNDDATVTLTYHLEWEVLESDGIGPVSWVTVGIPNGHYSELSAISSNISSIEYNGGNAEIYFTQDYYEGSVISFDFEVVCDNMYSVNALQNGYTVYYFTPGWFDGIAVDKLMIAWNASMADSWSGDCTQQDGYLLWVKSLSAGEQFSIQVSYPNDAFAFDESKGYSEGDDYQYYDASDYYYEKPSAIALIGSLIGSLIPILFIILIIKKLKKAAQTAYDKYSGLASGETEKKVTRTKIVYFDNCPGCGAPRQENAQTCPFCGRDMIKSEEVISEETIKDEDKDALKYDKKGEFHYSSDPNTFVRVNVVHVPVMRPTVGGPRVNSRGGAPGGGGAVPRGSSGRGRSGSGSSRGGSSRGGSSRGGGGCAHSSCACACVSCACACACACAGGGRAGCSTKDFYKTNLKLKQLERKKK